MYKKSLSMHLKSAFQYRASTFLVMASQLMVTLAEFLSVLMMMTQFKVIGGYPLANVCIMFGIIMIGFPASECFGRGFDMFSKQVRTGELDRLFLRPRTIFAQTFCADFELSKMGKILIGTIALIYGLIASNISWNFAKVLCVILCVGGSFTIGLSALIINAGITIFTHDDIEIMNIITNGSREVSQYPLTIYPKWFRTFFTVILPLACVNYLPILFLIDAPNANVFANMLAPVWGSLVVIPAILFFNFALTKYTSSGT